jgi:hypothetical protein
VDRGEICSPFYTRVAGGGLGGASALASRTYCNASCPCFIVNVPAGDKRIDVIQK